MKLSLVELGKLVGGKVTALTTVGDLGSVPGANIFTHNQGDILAITGETNQAVMSFGTAKFFMTGDNKCLAFGTLLRKIDGARHADTEKWAAGLDMMQIKALLTGKHLKVTYKEQVDVPAYDQTTRTPLFKEDGVTPETRKQSWLGFSLCDDKGVVYTEAQIKKAIADAIK